MNRTLALPGVVARHCGKSPVTTNKVLHRVELTCENPLSWIEVVFQVT
jgi:hypothetical protein